MVDDAMQTAAEEDGDNNARQDRILALKPNLQRNPCVLSAEYFESVGAALVMRLRQHEETVSRDGTERAGIRHGDMIERDWAGWNETEGSDRIENWGDLNAAIIAHFTGDRNIGPDFTSSSPIVSHSGEVGEIPIEVRDGTEQSHHLVLVPTVDGFSGKSDAVRAETLGTAITDRDVDFPIALSGDASVQDGPKEDALHDSSNDTN
ncbi:hypothetical protein RHMOL_Rhmol07G0241800 [Rhododendron molle]|uniref:Uncharacterized protein n=1 Tax=Rhododendron molle TaxID=49168 RepID=A0ACC0N5N6_RHOML|nr:hypothetical protein RHMOL_Rhmol07G0241800 [Rhododendron molle]